MKIQLRKHITRFALLVGMALLLAACGGAGGDAPPTVETFDVTGTVTDGAGAGIADVTISFGSSASSVTTDSDGAWAQTGLTGDVTITPKHNDYIFAPESRKVSKAQNNVNFTGYKKGPLSLELIASATDIGLGGTITLTAALAGTDAPQATITWDTPADGTLEKTSNATATWQGPTGSGVAADTYTLEVTATHGSTTLTESVTIQTHLCNTGDATDPTNPCTISTATQLQAIGAHLTGHFAVGADIDATEVKSWHNNAGFQPIGDDNDRFAGTFNGQGHTISNLYMNYPNGDDIGLFGYTDSAAKLKNIILSGTNIVTDGAGIGSLVGVNEGHIENSEAINPKITGRENVGGLVGSNTGGVISGSRTTGQHTEIKGVTKAGGLVGLNMGLNTRNAEIIESHSEDVTVQADNAAGGLVGRNQSNSTITQSSTTNATVTIAQHGEANSAGGAVGVNGATIEQTSAVNPTVTGKEDLGGLVGWNLRDGGLITDSSSVNATVIGEKNIGGLVGYNGASLLNTPAGIITKSSAQKPTVSGFEQVGGLVGRNGGKIEESYATGLSGSGTSYEGSVTATTNTAGGLIGDNGTDAEVKRSYSSGLEVSGENSGGLIGYNNGEVEETYSLNILPATNSGGLIAQAGTDSNVTRSYWATQPGGPASSKGGSKKQPGDMVKKLPIAAGAKHTGRSPTNTLPP